MKTAAEFLALAVVAAIAGVISVRWAHIPFQVFAGWFCVAGLSIAAVLMAAAARYMRQSSRLRR